MIARLLNLIHLWTATRAAESESAKRHAVDVEAEASGEDDHRKYDE